MSRIAGSNVVVTGGASGLGRRIALRMQALGATVVLWDMDRGNLDAVIAEGAARAAPPMRGYPCDVSDRDDVYAKARQCEGDVGPIDILVSCAGVVSGKPLLEIPDEKIEATFGVNTLALFWACKAFLPGMIERNRGHVVTLASASGYIGVAKLSDYAASKWAAIGFDESLRAELKRTAPGVKTTVVCPYYIDTGMFHGVKSRHPRLMPILREDDVAARVVRAIARDQRRLVMPWSVALVPLLRVLPIGVFDRLAAFLGINVSMDEFVGRHGGPPVERDDRATGHAAGTR
jgi:all-trans-retinol dehydrogenase (NAD+)